MLKTSLDFVGQRVAFYQASRAKKTNEEDLLSSVIKSQKLNQLSGMIDKMRMNMRNRIFDDKKNG